MTTANCPGSPFSRTPPPPHTSCSEDRTVLIWTQTEPGGPWEPKPLAAAPFEAPVWRVSWSITGNLLAVSSGDHKVTLWKQALSGEWDQINDVNEAGEAKAAGEGPAAAAGGGF